MTTQNIVNPQWRKLEADLDGIVGADENKLRPMRKVFERVGWGDKLDLLSLGAELRNVARNMATAGYFEYPNRGGSPSLLRLTDKGRAFSGCVLFDAAIPATFLAA